MATYLDRILAAHREQAAADLRPVSALVEEARSRPPARGFAAALAGATGLGVIAEVKRRSPSKGDLHAGLDPAQVSTAYAAGGATCLSVLTDREWFGGSPEDLVAARAAVDLPVLRKDFTVCEADVCDARTMGADAVLLIAAALDDAELAGFHQLVHEVGLRCARGDPRRGRARAGPRGGGHAGGREPARPGHLRGGHRSGRGWRRRCRRAWCGWPSPACGA
ncbi:MAG: hypothetical protein R2746_01645 [Acidimicrobiales bacterium]